VMAGWSVVGWEGLGEGGFVGWRDLPYAKVVVSAMSGLTKLLVCVYSCHNDAS
jgi:hypothetical protein